MSSEAWYWIGFLAADGYVRGTCVTLVQKDASEPVLRRFLEFVGSPDRPLIQNRQKPAKAAHASSPQIVQDLARHGVVPGKTYNLRTSAAAATEPMFWLGVFDGDGCITISRDGVPTVALVGTLSLMRQYVDFLQAWLDGRRMAIVRQAAGQSILWEVRVTGDRARQVAELWLACSRHSLEAKRRRLTQAASYESRVTRARLAVRRRRCDYCGAWLERMPSQFGAHAFCSRAHFGRWNVARRGSFWPPASRSGQLQLGLTGL